MARIMAFDYGGKRTGIAVTDPLQIIASGLTTVATDKVMDFLETYLFTEEVECFVVGDPRSLDNEATDATSGADEFAEKLKKKYPHIQLEREDERFTSKMALRSLIDSGVSKKKRRNKALIDEVSATLILQSYLGHI